MEKALAVAQVITPIFAAVLLGFLARRKRLLREEEVEGLQQFAVKFGLPCIIFQACLTAKIGPEAIISMVLCLIPLLAATLWAFWARKGNLRYHNLPMLFAAHETGMLGIPLTITLFGAAQSYRMGVLDLAQAFIAFPVIALLTADAGENPRLGKILRSVFSSPLMMMSLTGLVLNLTGVTAWLESVGALGIVTEPVGFLGQPVSALMLFSVGYHFSMDAQRRGDIFRVAGIYLGWFGLTGLAIQGILCLVPGVEEMTRWVMLLNALLPASYLAPGLGRSAEDRAMASGVCSLLTVVTLIVFCVISVFTA